MPTICPKCSHPVRTGAQYCGFCGSNLNSIESVEPAILHEKDLTTQNSRPQELPKAKKRDIGRTMAVISIFVLILVIALALLIQYWTEVVTFLGSFLSSLFSG